MALKRVVVLFDSGQYARLKGVARETGESVSALVRRAVEREYLRPTDDERRQAVRELLRLEIPVGSWEEVKEDLLKARSHPLQTS